MSQQQYDYEVSREEWEEMQAALPPHKREGYAERAAEWAELQRDAEKDAAWTTGFISVGGCNGQG